MPCMLVPFIVVNEKSKFHLKLFDYLWRLQLCLLYVTIEQTVADLFILFLLYSICPCYITPVLFLGTRSFVTLTNYCNSQQCYSKE